MKVQNDIDDYHFLKKKTKMLCPEISALLKITFSTPSNQTYFELLSKFCATTEISGQIIFSKHKVWVPKNATHFETKL